MSDKNSEYHTDHTHLSEEDTKEFSSHILKHLQQHVDMSDNDKMREAFERQKSYKYSEFPVTDIDDPYGTTAVLVGRAKELADRVKKADDRVMVLVDTVKLAEAYLAERVSNSGTVGRTVVLPALRKALNATPQQTANDDEVLACPFCGSTDISDGEALIGKDDETTAVQSQCLDCGAFGPEASLDQGEIDFGDVKAIAAWNRRYPTTTK